MTALGATCFETRSCAALLSMRPSESRSATRHDTARPNQSKAYRAVRRYYFFTASPCR